VVFGLLLVMDIIVFGRKRKRRKEDIGSGNY